MISGMRNDPPISTNSPRDTGTSRPKCQRVEHEHHCRRIVVDHRGCLSAGDLANLLLEMTVTVAALGAIQIVLKIACAARHGGYSCNCLLRQRSAAEIGMQDCAGQIEHLPQHWSSIFLYPEP